MTIEKQLHQYLNSQGLLEDWLDTISQLPSIKNMPMRSIWHKMIYRKEPDLYFISHCQLSITPLSGVFSSILHQSMIYGIHHDLLYWGLKNVPKKSIIKDTEKFIKNFQDKTFITNALIHTLEPIIYEQRPQNAHRLIKLLINAQDIYIHREKGFDKTSQQNQDDILENIKKFYQISPQELQSMKIRDESLKKYINYLMLSNELPNCSTNKPKIKI